MKNRQRQVLYESQARPVGHPAPAIPALALPSADMGRGGVDRLIAAAVKTGGSLINAYARDYAREQRGKIEERVLSAQREFEEWKAEYKRTHQGGDALNSQADFAAKFSEIAGRIQENFRGGPGEIWEGELGRELFKHGLYALREGGNWQTAQSEAWHRNRLERQTANFEAVCANFPEDGERISLEREGLIRSWENAHPGLDSSGFARQLDNAATKARLDSYLALGDTAGARRLLAGIARTEGMGESTSGAIRAAAAKHGVPEELALAVAMQESGGRQGVVSHAGARGVMQLMPGTAKQLGVDINDEGQNIEGGVRYLGMMLKKYGDIETALLAYNWGPGNVDAWRAGKRKDMPREAREYAGRVFGRMSGSGVSPAMAAKGLNAIEAAERKAAQEGVERRFNTLWDEVKDLPGNERQLKIAQFMARNALTPEQKIRALDRLEAVEERNARQAEASRDAEDLNNLNQVILETRDNDPARRQAAVYSWLVGIADPQKRLRLEHAATQQLALDDRAAAARATLEAADFLNSARDRGLSYVQTMEELNRQGGLSEAARKRVHDVMAGPASKPTMQNVYATSMGMLAIDEGRLPSTEERMQFAFNNALTPAQFQKLMEYRGNMADVSLTRVGVACDQLGIRLDKRNIDLWSIYQRVQQFAPKGKPLTTADLQRIVAMFALEGKIQGEWFGTTWIDAYQRGKASLFSPEIQKSQINTLDEELRYYGHKTNDKNRQALRAWHAGILAKPQWNDEEGDTE